jgi:uncharacterized protein (TIGR03118 family)
MWSRDFRTRSFVAGLAATAAAGTLVLLLPPGGADAYVVSRLVSDGSSATRVHDAALVNAWGLAASPTGPWWTANEARAASSLFDGSGRRQALSVSVEGGPTGIVYNNGPGFLVRAGGVAAPARFIYACEDGSIRGWAPVVPHGWSKEAVVAVDEGLRGAVFRGLAIATLPGGSQRLYATDFHNGRVEMLDGSWRRIVQPGAFVDRAIPAGYTPFGIRAVDGRVFVTYASPAPVNGNDAPVGGFVDEYDLDGTLVARVGSRGSLAEPWGLAVAPAEFGRFGGDLLVGNFGSGHIDAYVRRAGRWSFDGQLPGKDGEPLEVVGLWGLAFGNGRMAGPKDVLFFTAGPHRWLGASELQVHGSFGSIAVAPR